METINIDVSNADELFEAPVFPTITPGVHSFAVAKVGDVTDCSESENKMISCEFRCVDEDENKGLPLFERFIIMVNPVTDGQVTARKINQRSMTQFCLACGVTTKETIRETGELPIKACEDTFFKAQTGVKANKYKGETTMQSAIKKYLFDEKDLV